MSFRAMLNLTATRKVPTSTPGEETGFPVQTTADTPGIPCAIQPATSRVALERQKRTGTTTYDGFWLAGQVVGIDDLWQIDTGPANSTLVGRTFRVVGPGMDAAGRGHHVEALLEENRP